MTFARDDTFVLGLTMAGAVSAGAYTAGVLDFLVEALDAWTAEKSNANADVPRHNVVLAAISGTSAGGVCAPLMCAAMAAGDAPVERRPVGLIDENTKQPIVIRNYLPRLYDAWVVKPTLAASGDAPSFLNLSDIAGAGAVQSLLNSSLLENIGKMALSLPPGGSTRTYSYISEKLHLFAMVGNALGVPYKINFTGGAHGMALHGDRIHSRVEGLGTHSMQSIWAAQEEPHVVANTQALFAVGLSTEWRQVLDMAMASCAFPAALKSRILKFPHQRWDKRIWPSEAGYVAGGTPQTGAYPKVVPDWPPHKSPFVPWDYEFLNVDGGIANNEPFEYARYSIKTDVMKPNPSKGEEVDRMVLMIDPFPEPPTIDMVHAQKSSLLDSLKPMVGVMINQARFKMDELMHAADENYFSRYLIAPWEPGQDAQPDSKYLASGGLGGFAGFIEETFRAHDFQLGRRNCQKFLRDHLAVPAGAGQAAPNRIIAATWGAKRLDPSWARYRNQDGGTPGQFCQVIPLVGRVAHPEPKPEWPMTNDERLRQIERQIVARLEVVGPKLLGELNITGVVGTALNLALKLGKGALAAKITRKIREALVKRKQMKQ